jgi:hypothetical protein
VTSRGILSGRYVAATAPHHDAGGATIDARAGTGQVLTAVPQGAILYSGHYYVLTPVPLRWDQAESYARKIGGHLAAINDAGEQSFAQSRFAGYEPWVGATDQAAEGMWTYADGQPIGYAVWAAGHPLAPADGGNAADYVMMAADGT